jgi:hypothetical protein
MDIKNHTGQPSFPMMFRVRQRLDASTVGDIAGEIDAQVDALALQDRVSAGQSVAVACSSRGIANYATVVAATVAALKRLGLKPFLVPAMGSHGSATGDGQKRVLENYGLTEARVGAPVRSSLDVDQVGQTPEGIPVCIDRHANRADHIVLINRIKHHTEFEHEVESGLMKMMAIGLGKQAGATLYHKAIMIHGYPQVIVSVARRVLAAGKVLFGVGLVENGFSDTAAIRVADGATLESREIEALTMAKRLTPALPFDEADVLIIDEMGKDISGTGFDTKVVGRILMPLVAEEPATPRVKRIVVCDLTRHTAGNADGIGIADFCTRRLVDKIDLEALYVNALAGAEPEHAKIPLTLETDRAAVRAAIDSVGLIPLKRLKVIRILNTLQMEQVALSTAYLTDAQSNPNLEILGRPEPMVFDDNGNLRPL